jgi:HD-GYP domain-containing protein (c-di-GMP phosphodiesterase class II)
MLAMTHRDVTTAEHCRRVADLCLATAEGLMSQRECFVLEVAGQLHDIGKLGVPDTILHKPGPLTEEELRVMREHKGKSVEVIESIISSPELTETVRNHSAWYGGTPHNPDLPKGKDIPLGSRILNIADAFSSMTSDRPYRSALDYEEAFKELRRCAGTQFDPALVEHFIEVVRTRDESRKNDSATVSNAARMEIGCEVEKLLVAASTNSLENLANIAEQLASKAAKHGFVQITGAATLIKKATEQNRDLVEILSLTSEFAKAYGSGELCQPEQEGLHGRFESVRSGATNS